MRSGVEAPTGSPEVDVCAVSTQRSNLIKVPSEINKVSVDAIVDTASEISIISETAFKKTGLMLDDEEPAVNLRMANGTVTPAKRQASTSIKIGDCSYDIRLIVLEKFPYDVLVGLDFILCYDTSINSREGEVWIGESCFKLPNPTSRTPHRNVGWTDTRTVIPPRSEIVMPIRCSKRNVGTFLVEGIETCESMGLSVAATLSESSDRLLLARVANITPHEIVLEKGTALVKWEKVEFDIETETNTETEHNVDLMHVDSDRLYADREKTTRNFKSTELDIGTSLTPEQRKQVVDLIETFDDIMSKHESDVGRTDLLKHHIETGNAAPIHDRPYRISFAERKAVRSLVDEYIDAGLIRESTSPWACPIVLVKKKDGTMRFCCDWRKLNKVTTRDAMPLPLINDMIDRLAKAKYFTKLDFTSGYYQVELDETSIEKSAFVTPDGHFEWLVMGMGLTNAPATFQRLMYKVLGGLLWTTSMAYMDDLVVYSESFDEHIAAISEVFSRIRQSKLKIKPPKCSFAKTGIHYLGFVISADGVQCDPAITEKVQAFAKPKSKRDVRSFLGLTSYYRRFILNYAFIAKPLHDLTKDDANFVFEPKHETAFETLKQALVSPPVLAFPDFEKPFIVSTDASGYGIGCVLKQLDETKRERVIAYASRVLRPEEQRYSTYKREFLGLRYATIIFRPYLYGTKFVVHTDHQSLRHLRSKKAPNGWMQRWVEDLSEFDFDIVYKTGKTNTDADTLSRYGMEKGTVFFQFELAKLNCA